MTPILTVEGLAGGGAGDLGGVVVALSLPGVGNGESVNIQTGDKKDGY